MKKRPPHIYSAGTVRPDPAWHLSPHFHPFHEIIVVLQGGMHLKTPGETLSAGPGDVLFYRAGLVHEEISDRSDPVSTFFIAFDIKDNLPWLPLRIYDARGRIRQLVAWLVEEVGARRSPEIRKPIFDVLMEELRALCAMPPDPWIESILGFMRKNLARPLTLDDLASQAKMSKFAFVRKFKRHCGRTPMEELRLIRLDRARTLLLTTNLPVKSVAPAVGIGDEYQLSKLFRAHFNLSPSHLRTRSAGGKPAR